MFAPKIGWTYKTRWLISLTHCMLQKAYMISPERDLFHQRVFQRILQIDRSYFAAIFILIRPTWLRKQFKFCIYHHLFPPIPVLWGRSVTVLTCAWDVVWNSRFPSVLSRQKQYFWMTSWYWCAFCIVDPLWGESTSGLLSSRFVPWPFLG